MHYIEMITVESEKYYIECSTLEQATAQFWQLVNEQNTKQVIVFQETDTGSLFSVKASELQKSALITQAGLSLTRAPRYVKLLTKGN